MTYPLRVQAIRSRGQTPRLYVSFPLALAAAIGLEPGMLTGEDGQGLSNLWQEWWAFFLFDQRTAGRILRGSSVHYEHFAN
jgi:hypothetical protein